MEQALEKLEGTWRSLEFEFEQYRDQEVRLLKMREEDPTPTPTPHPYPSPLPLKVRLLKMREEDFETLEDNQLVVQGMMASKYLATFEAQVTAWQGKLANVSEALSQMTEVQRKWAYLETLFIGSEEVKKELPDSATRFLEIDKTFQATCTSMFAAKNAVAASNSDGLLQALEEMGVGLELCEKALAEFLESKRRIFPRFYFASTNMLLDILSNGNRPWVVATHINALFQVQ